MSDAMKEIEKLRDFTEKRNPAHAVYARESLGVIKAEIERLRKIEEAATAAVVFIRSEYEAMNDDGDLIPNPDARKVHNDLVDALFAGLAAKEETR